jgi:HlyD family secretion protein
MRDLSRDIESLHIDRGQPPPTGMRRRWLIFVAIVIAIAVVGLLVWQFALLRLTRPVVSVGEIVTLSPAQADVKQIASGYVVPMRHAVITPKVPGRLESVLVKEGDEVKEGQLLATLESADLRATLNDAKAALASARARVFAVKASITDAKLQLDRETRLLSHGNATQASVDTMQSRYDIAVANLHAAEADVESAAARVANAQVAVSYARITAPFDGRIVRKMAEAGEVPTNALYQSTAGGIVELVDFSSLVVEADVSESRIGSVKLGDPTEVSLDAFPSKRFRGKVTELRPTVDRQKATVLTRVKFVDPIPGVFPQMAAKVLFLSKALDEQKLKEPPKTVVPASALVDRAGAKAIFVLSEGRIHLTPVVVGEAIADGFELKQGPAPGTKVVIHPPSFLRDSDSVREKT